MHSNLFQKIAASLLLGLTAAAQACPKTESVDVTEPNPIRYGASVSCSGLSFSVPGLTLTTTTGCPLFVEIHPDTYSVVRSTKADTEAVSDQQQSIVTHFFKCEVSYIIFIPISSSCEYSRTVVRPGRELKKTVACNDRAQQ
jgi:hypothetical protein